MCRSSVMFLAVALGLFIWASNGEAEIIGATGADDGDGKIVCSGDWNGSGSDPILTITGDQYGTPGHVLGTFTTDTAVDPTITVRNTIDNETNFAWTSFLVTVAMDHSYTLSTWTVYLPSGWTESIVSSPTYDGNGEWVAQLLLTGQTPIAVGDAIDFSFKLAFSGTTSYAYCLTMEPVPEPSTLAMTAALSILGLFAFLGRRKAAKSA